MLTLDKLQEALRAGCAEYGLQKEVEIIEVKHGSVVILDYTQNKNLPDFGDHMIKLERFMKHCLGATDLELQLESLEDKNRRDIKHGRAVAKMVNARNVESLE